MSSTSARGPGRPAIPDPETLAKGRLYCELVDFGLTANEIAARKGVAKSEVHRAMNLVRSPALVEPSRTGASDSQPEPQPRRLSRRVAQSRAWEYADQHPAYALGLAANNFWIRLVVAIHEEGDGFRLHMGESRSRFAAPNDLAILMAGEIFDRREIDIDGWLAALVARGRLIDIEGVDIGIPLGIGLTPGESARGKPVTTRAARRTIDQRQPFMPQVLDGGLSEQPISPDSESGNIRISPDISPDSESGDIRVSPDISPDISPDSDRLGRAAAAAANAKDIHNLAAAAATESRAPESGNIRISPDSESGEMSPAESGNIPSGEVSTPLTKLVADLVELARLGRHQNAKDLGALQRWLDKGVPVAMMRAVIETLRSRPNGTKPSSLAYFDNAMDEAMKAAKAPPPAAAASPASSKPPPPRSEADLALDARLEALHGCWAVSKTGPQPPLRDGFDAACRAWKAADALRWIAAEEGLLAAGLLADADLPEFHDYVARPNRFEDQMIEAEEALTAPDTS
jgi:hypothetical protein